MDKIEPIAPVEARPDNAIATENTGASGNINDTQLQGFFGIQTPNNGEQKTLDEITRLLDGNSMDSVDFLWTIKNTENRIGTPPLGTSRLQHVYNFIKINSQIVDLERERDLYG